MRKQLGVRDRWTRNVVACVQRTVGGTDGAAPGSEGFISNLRYRMLQEKRSTCHSDLIRIFSLANDEMQAVYNINTRRLSGHL